MKTYSLTKRSFAVLVTTLLLMVAIPVTSALASTTAEIVPTGGGNYSAWSNGYTTVDEGTAAASCAQSDSIITGFTGNRESVTISLGSIPNGSTITAVNVIVRDRGDNFSGGTYKTFVRLNGTDTADSTASHAAQGSSGGCQGSVNDAFDVTDTLKSGATTLEVGVVKTNTNTSSVRVGVLSATVTYTLATSVSVQAPTTVTYDGTQKTATVNGSVAGVVSDIKYNGSSTAPTNAGTYVVTADFVPTDSNYTSLNDAPAGNFVIAKANATCLVSGYNGEYDATAHGASGSCSGVGGENAGTLNLGDTFTNVPGGSAHWIFTGNGNYYNQSGDVAIDLSKVDATCSVDGFSGPYDLSAHGASGSCSGVGGENAGTLDLGTSFTNVPGGIADWIFTGNGNYNNQFGSVDITLTKVDATCLVNGFDGKYNATAHGASGSCSGIGGEAAGTLDLGLSFLNVPGGSADWTFTSNGNYNDQAGSVDIVITKIDADCSITGFSGPYDTAAHGANGSCSGVGGETAGTLDLGASFTNVPGGQSDWAFTGNGNYNDQSGSVDVSIDKIEASCSVTGFSGPYDATAHGAGGSCSGVGGETAGTLDLGASFSNVPGGQAHWAFIGNGNYSDQEGDVVIDLSKVDATCLVNGFSGLYDATAHGANGSCSGIGGEAAGTLDLGASFTKVPGGAAHWSFIGDGNYNDQEGDAAIDIAKANALIVVNPYSITYTGFAHVSSGMATGVSGEDLSAGLDLSTTSHTNANSYTDDAWTFTAPNANYKDASGTLDNEIAKANADCSSIAGYSVPFDGKPHTATGSCQGVGSEGALTGLDLSLTTHTAMETYPADPWTFTDVTGNYNDADGKVSSSINDMTYPVVASVTRAGVSPSSASSVAFTVTFSEAVTGVGTSAPFADFSLFTSGIHGASITAVSGSGSFYTVTVNTGAGDGTIRLDVIDDDSIHDSANNALGGSGIGNGNFTSGEVYTINKSVTLPMGWVGGVSISSNKNVVTVGRPHIGAEIASYDGFSSGSLTSYVPMLFKNAYGTYNSALYVQNVASSKATITIKYYDSEGVLKCTKNDTLDSQSSKGYWVPSESCLPDGWVGGAVVTSDQPIVTVGRPHVGSEVMTYNGFTGGSLTTYIPMLFNNTWGSYNSAFYLQNTNADSQASITINYYDDKGLLKCTKGDTIKPFASKGYWVPSATCDTGSLPNGWVGGVVVTSDQPIVGVGRSHIGTQVTTYNGFTTGGLTSYLPMLFSNAWGSYNSAFYIQNTNSNLANITIQYYDDKGFLKCTKTDTISGLASKGYWVPSETCLPAGWVGSVVVTSDQPVVGVGRPHIGTQVTTYNGFTAGNPNAYLPMLFNNTWGSYNSAFYVQNTEDSDATVTLNFYDETGKLSCTRTDTVAALSTLGYWVPSVTCNP